jgi:hypothetical protein
MLAWGLVGYGGTGFRVKLLILMVGAEGFEGSFPSDRYAVFFVRFNCKITQFEGFARILRRTLLSRIFSPMDNFSQDFRITSYQLIASKIVQNELKIGTERTGLSTPESVQMPTTNW